MERTGCGLLGFDFSSCNAFEVHPHCSMCQDCIPFYGHITLPMYRPYFIHELMDIWVLFNFSLLIMLQTFLSEFMDVNFKFFWVYINLGVELQTCNFCSLLFVVCERENSFVRSGIQ